MKTQLTIVLTLLVGFAMGAVAVQGLHAQGKPPTYVVIDISGYTDAQGFKAVTTSGAASPARTAELGGHYVMRTEMLTPLLGTPPKRFVVLAFDSKEKAQSWYEAPDTKAINAIREKTTMSRVFMADGFAN